MESCLELQKTLDELTELQKACLAQFRRKLCLTNREIITASEWSTFETRQKGKIMRTVNANIYRRIEPLPPWPLNQERYDHPVVIKSSFHDYDDINRLIPVADGFEEKNFVQYVSHFR